MQITDLRVIDVVSRLNMPPILQFFLCFSVNRLWLGKTILKLIKIRFPFTPRTRYVNGQIWRFVLKTLKACFHYNCFCRKDRLCRFTFLGATETIMWKRSSQTTEAILAIETILAYRSSEIDSSSISDDLYARIVSIARIASVV